MSTDRRLLKGIVALLCMAVVACAWWHPLEARASERVGEGLKKALATYATARILHGAVSVLQGTQVNAEPAGVGATFSPGQVLAPVAEMLKQFSDVMLIVCVAFGIQKVLITLGSHAAVASVLTVVALGWLWAAMGERRPPAWLSKIFLLLVMVQFAVPLTLLGSDQIFQRFLAAEYQQSQQSIDLGASEAARTREPVTIELKDRNVFERLKDWYDNKTTGAVAQYQAIKQIAANVTEHIVRLIALFVLQTIILPLLLLWALYAMTRTLLRWPGDMTVSSMRPQP